MACLFLPGCAVEFLFDIIPAVDVVILKRRFVRGERRQVLREARLEHERHGVVQLLRLQVRVGRAFKGVFVGSVRQHHVVQAHPAGDEAFGLGIILP